MAEERQASTVVTSDNLAEHLAKGYGLSTPEEAAKAAEDAAAAAKAETDAKAAEAELIAQREKNGGKTDAEVAAEQAAEVEKEAKRKAEARERWEKLTAQRREAMEKAAALEAENKALREKLEPPKQNTKPNAANYSDVGEFTKALEDWTREQTRVELERERQAQEAKSRQDAIDKSWTDRVSGFAKENQDFADTLQSSNVVVSDEVRDAIKESDVGPAILYHLAKNPDEAEKIAGMTVAGALRYLGRLESALEKKADPAPAAAVEPPKPSAAPAPIAPIKGGSAPGIENGEGLSFQKYRELRRAGKIH